MRGMQEKKVDGKKPPRNDIPMLVIVNAALIVFSVVVLVSVNAYYEREIRESALTESRFVTTEWHLLRELKEDTDQQLEAKEQEIAVLRRQLGELVRRDASPQERAAIEGQLERAQEERSSILAGRLGALQAPAERSPDASGVIPPVPPIVPDGIVERTAEKLTERIAELEMELETADAILTAVEDTLAATQTDRERVRSELARLRGETERQIAALEESIAAARSEARTAAVEFERVLQQTTPEQGGREEPDQSLLAAVGTRALMRAILTSPSIRAEYPGLAAEVERYFEIFGAERARTGRREAYAGMSRALETLAAATGADMQVAAPEDTAAGYRERLAVLIRHAFTTGVVE